MKPMPPMLQARLKTMSQAPLTAWKAASLKFRSAMTFSASGVDLVPLAFGLHIERTGSRGTPLRSRSATRWPPMNPPPPQTPTFCSLFMIVSSAVHTLARARPQGCPGDESDPARTPARRRAIIRSG